MTTYPKIKVSRLREIGWMLWDPIGLAGADGSFGEGCADEYDGYLLHVVSLLYAGKSPDEAAAYLISIASERMGLSDVDARATAATAQAIASYLGTLHNDPKAVRVRT